MSPDNAIIEIKKFIKLCSKITYYNPKEIGFSMFKTVYVGKVGIMAYFDYSAYFYDNTRKHIIVSIYDKMDSKVNHKDYHYNLDIARINYCVIESKIKEVM